jgi:hypothetical protein
MNQVQPHFPQKKPPSMVREMNQVPASAEASRTFKSG